MKKLVLTLALALAACEAEVDRGACLQSHTETTIVPIMIACGQNCFTMMPLPTTYTVCDRWEFPKGRPQQQ